MIDRFVDSPHEFLIAYTRILQIHLHLLSFGVSKKNFKESKQILPRMVYHYSVI